MKLQRKNRLRALSLGAVALTGALTLTACGSDDTTGGTSGGTGENTPAAGSIDCGDAKGQLLADGSSAQKNAIDAWVKQYQSVCKDVVKYMASHFGVVPAMPMPQIHINHPDHAAIYDPVLPNDPVQPSLNV